SRRVSQATLRGLFKYFSQGSSGDDFNHEITASSLVSFKAADRKAAAWSCVIGFERNLLSAAT
ncbi:MAG: hypothetical protein ACREDR_14560, partial [Blastocatellia bacterium]